ncbi:non-ribosomal peptide synthetase [Streptomyces sp. AN091965]|uniref:non-ribosomal peptide synthetase n=1 Tax=Streptomyces sp. AN091965 TaxID=2927803 RepID=UPI001F5FFBB4|nr:amino acid adenylation domain-containing protein [Streptomyces sp. AN091965]MCI3929116.1 amino acid adenylation domain-containing protein [Streptomyces sp. AN091965]
MSRRVHDVFEATAAASPDAVAVRAGTTVLTYRELDTRANRVAHELRAAGVGPESVVGVLLERGPWLLPVLLGIWKAGGSQLALDAALPTERLAYMLDTAGARLVVTQRTLAGLLGDAYDGELLDLDRDQRRIRERPGTAPGPAPAAPAGPPQPDGLAYTLFTSGSTGRPKGVQIAHGSLLNLLFSMRARFDAAPEHVWLAATSVSFDISYAELYLPLITGGSVVLVDDSGLGDALAQLDLIDTHGVTHIQATPAGWKLLLAAGFADRPLTAVTTGEACPPSLGRELRDHVERLVNLYGPTETTVWSTGWEVPAGPPDMPVGRPIHNTRAYVLDAALQPVPVGVIGELYLAGTGVARGYVGRPGLTAGRFLPEELGGPPGSRMYRTGDWVRFRADGELEYLGRADHQVKIRGYRVELGEIEEQLVTHPGVGSAVVVAREDGQGEPWLVAYVVPTGGRAEPGEPGKPEAAEAGQDELRRHLAARLPGYMVPTGFVLLDRLPLNAAGKVDRAALPAPQRTALVADRAYQAPRTATERLLADVCAEVLGVPGVGAHDRLADLGVDSMRIVHVLAAGRRAGLTVTLRMLLDSVTIADLGAAIDGTPATYGAQDDDGHPQEAHDAHAAGDGEGNAADDGTGCRSRAGAPVTGGTPAPDVEAVMAAHGIPGAAVAVLRDGEVAALHVHGVRSMDSGAPVTLRTRFQAGSISKHVIAFAALRLVADGPLALDEPLDAYLTGRTVPRLPGGGRVTLRHCLSNTAGLSSASATWWHPDETMPTLSDVLDDVGAEAEPGSLFRKAGSQWAFVEQVLTDATGQELGKLVDDLVFRELGMRDSAFAAGGAADLAAGHDRHGEALHGGHRCRPARAGSGLWSTPADLAQFAGALRRTRNGLGDLLPGPLADAMLTEAFPGSFYGLGTVIDGSLGDVEFGHGGQTPGYRALTSLRLRSGTGCVVMTNSDLGKEVHKAVAAGLGRDITARLAGD